MQLYRFFLSRRKQAKSYLSKFEVRTLGRFRKLRRPQFNFLTLSKFAEQFKVTWTILSLLVGKIKRKKERTNYTVGTFLSYFTTKHDYPRSTTIIK